MRIAVNVSHVSDEVLAFFGFNLVWSEKDFKVYRDKYHEDHIVYALRPFIVVDSDFDADALRSSENIEF